MARSTLLSVFLRDRLSRALRCAMVIGPLLVWMAPTNAQGQASDVVLGTVLGAAGGAYITAGIISGQALSGRFVTSPRSLGWRLAPIPLGALGGGILGATDGDGLDAALRWGTVGWALGTAAGAGVGFLGGGSAEDTWSGVLVGGAVGILAGAVAGAALGSDQRGSPSEWTLELSVPW